MLGALLIIGRGNLPHIFAQPSGATSTESLPSFEVVSIHAHEPGYWPSFQRREFTPDGFIWLNASTQALIVDAYDLRDPRLQRELIPGAPKWIRSDWYDIRARISESDADKLKQMNPTQREAFRRELLQSLLLDRFKLKARLVPKETKLFELVVAKNGPRNFRQASPDEKQNMQFIDLGDAQFSAFTLEPLVLFSEMEVDCLVVDKSGLTGKYDFELKWARSPRTMAPPGTPGAPPQPEDDGRPSLPQALEEQLGLKLIPAKADLNQIVIDHIEKPSPD